MPAARALRQRGAAHRAGRGARGRPVGHPRASQGGVDLRHRFEGVPPGHHARMITPPAILGHELAGDIVEVGSAVKHFQVGNRVGRANSAPCFKCFFCRRDQKNLCENLLFNNGAYARYVKIPGPIADCNTHRIPRPRGLPRGGVDRTRLACVLNGLGRNRSAAGRYGHGHRPGADRADVRAAGERSRARG